MFNVSKIIGKSIFPLFPKTMNIANAQAKYCTMKSTSVFELSKIFEDIEQISSLKTIKINTQKRSIKKLKKITEKFIAEFYELFLGEGKICIKDFSFHNAVIIFNKIIESIPKLNVKNNRLTNILSEAYVQNGIILSKGGIKESAKAFEYFKISANLNPKNELAKEKILEMRYECGELQ